MGYVRDKFSHFKSDRSWRHYPLISSRVLVHFNPLVLVNCVVRGRWKNTLPSTVGLSFTRALTLRGQSPWASDASVPRNPLAQVGFCWARHIERSQELRKAKFLSKVVGWANRGFAHLQGKLEHLQKKISKSVEKIFEPAYCLSGCYSFLAWSPREWSQRPVVTFPWSIGWVILSVLITYVVLQQDVCVALRGIGNSNSHFALQDGSESFLSSLRPLSLSISMFSVIRVSVWLARVWHSCFEKKRTITFEILCKDKLRR